jgi:hypothetical protein
LVGVKAVVSRFRNSPGYVFLPPIFDLTVGYNFLYYKASHSISSREFTFKQTVHGPMAGIGFYF